MKEGARTGTEIWHRIAEDWWLSLIFFFDFCFYQGRGDWLSSDYENATIKALTELLGDPSQKLISVNQLKRDGWLEPKNWDSPINPLRIALNKKYRWDPDERPPNIKGHIRKGFMTDTGKPRDREMVAAVIRFVSGLELDNHSIVKHAIRLLINRQINRLAENIDSIRGVGEKITSLFIRNIVTFYSPISEDSLARSELKWIFPLDTWVNKLTKRLHFEGIDQFERRDNILAFCLENNISPIALNEGLWYVGANSFDILLDILMHEGVPNLD
ncbi:MAG: hypothetical protein Q8N65_01310 [bacterium]|nr:hypothetical protein [bacterium]